MLLRGWNPVREGLEGEVDLILFAVEFWAGIRQRMGHVLLRTYRGGGEEH